MEPVAIFAPAYEASLHTRAATLARTIGAAPGIDPVNAYLNIDVVIDAARATQCDCVHPGYGFLSDNSEFAARCAEAGLTFVGPRAETHRLFGDKTRARLRHRWMYRSCHAASAQ